MRNMVERFGVTWPTYGDWISAGVALFIVILVWAFAWWIGRLAGPRLADFWVSRAGASGERIGPRMCALVRFTVAALLLALVLSTDRWLPLGAVVLGLGLATAAGLLVSALVRGLRMPGWIGALLGGAVFFVLLARTVGGLEPITEALDQVGFTGAGRRFSLLTVTQMLVILVAIYALVKLLNRLALQAIRRTHGLDATQQLLSQKLAAVAILVAAFFLGIDLLGIDLTALAVFSGAFGLAIGFGLQKTFGNLIAGIILLMDRSIKPGDVIAVGESFGHVNKIGVRAVSIITRDGKEHLIPNENLMTQEVENWSYSSRDVRLHIKVGVAYNCDLPFVQELMVRAAKESSRVLSQPEPRIWLRAFGESAIDHEILVWISDPELGVGSVQSEILNRLWRLFKDNDIVVPYPQRDVHIRDWPVPPVQVTAKDEG
ncbi:MAG TPA: mechanosensitive ion channel domain-containing protein [Allosphingosinicella sp.]|nr:mechanosensitive ion channel domain-containing protein [Allosphingosinicella sp.]